MPHEYTDDEDREPPYNAALASEQGVNASGGYSVPLSGDDSLRGYKSTAVMLDGGGTAVTVEVGWRHSEDVAGIVMVETKTQPSADPSTLFFVNQGDILDHVTLSGGGSVDYSVVESNQLPLPASAADAQAAYASKYRAELWSAAFNSVREAGNFSAIRDIDRNPDGIALINKGTSASGWLLNFNTGAYSDGADVGPYVDGSELVVAMPTLGPRGSVWGIDMVASVGPDHGILDFYWASLLDDVADAVTSFTGNHGAGLLESAYSLDNPALNFVKVSSVDCYAVGYHKAAWGGAFVSIGQFRMYGDVGDRLSSFSAPSNGDPVHTSADGGPGVWALKVKVNGKRAASTATRVGICSLSVTRQSWDGFYD
jgi:hypothetical protein